MLGGVVVEGGFDAVAEAVFGGALGPVEKLDGGGGGGGGIVAGGVAGAAGGEEGGGGRGEASAGEDPAAGDGVLVRAVHACSFVLAGGCLGGCLSGSLGGAADGDGLVALEGLGG